MLPLGEPAEAWRETRGLPNCRTWTGITNQPLHLSFPTACSLPTSLFPLVSGTSPQVSVQVFSLNCE